MEIEQKDKSAPVYSAEFVEQKDRYISKLEAEIKALREALKIWKDADNGNREISTSILTHHQMEKIHELTTKK
jgi:hypothetical protein